MKNIITATTVPAEEKQNSQGKKRERFETLIKESWEVIAPFWPLKNLIAVNPLQGFETLAIEDALLKSMAYFQQKTLPEPMEAINRETMKWLQAYFDEGQATIQMPQRSLGLYSAWKKLAVYDTNLHKSDTKKIDWLKSLSDSPKETLTHCLLLLKIPKEETVQFLKLLLSSMPGWASYIKYKTEWSGVRAKNSYPARQIDYLCMRAVITYLLWPEGRELLKWHQRALKESQVRENPLIQIEQFEKSYRFSLLEKLKTQKIEERHTPAAQLVFCIDVRSEPFRKALEATGDYETFGFAGFFGVPVQITDNTTGETYASCPVLLSPKHEINESPCCEKDAQHDERGHQLLTMIKKLYQSVKYTFTTPFALAEGLGIVSGAWIGVRTFSPTFAGKLKTITRNLFRKPISLTPSLDGIPLKDQCAYAESALRIMGLTEHFASLVVFCGHGSSTQNNAYASALDCGACGGNHGCSNARILAKILNQPEVRVHLEKQGIFIPETTQFIGAKHNTTTDEVTLQNTEFSDSLVKLKQDLEKAQEENSIKRLQKMKQPSINSSTKLHIQRRSQDWAQVRPEWGLARNAAFIAAPRNLTRSLDLDGRCFLHSYDYTQDSEGKSLQTILTAPMVVAQWINSQYLFSTMDNTSFGGGSKVTKNITGKIGIMQGNASDLMTGLPLQSVYSSDKEPFHEPQRLMTVVYAPLKNLDTIIQIEPVLQKLFGNGWVQLVCIEPESRVIYFLERNLRWKRAD